jgi:outer membrane protein OmpA-like peptidoglycan-associated protein
MRKTPFISAGLLGALAFLTTSAAHAEDFSLHLQPGMESPITKQQLDIYTPTGATLNAEGLFALHPNLAIGPAVQASYLARAVNTNQNAGVYWLFGLDLRLQGDRTSSDGVSPWIEGNLSLARTGDLNRPEMGLRIGIDAFTDQAHVASFGPWMGYTHIFQSSTTDSVTAPTLDSRDYNAFQVGLSANFDFPVHVKHVAVRHTVYQTEYRYIHVHDAPVAPAVLSYHQKVYFNWDSPVIRNWEEADKVAEIVQLMKDHPRMTVRVEGHASPDGNYQHNVVLAEKRTAAVVKYLLAHGVDSDRLTSESFGPDHPFVANTNQEGRERNRRVEFNVTFTTTESK